MENSGKRKEFGKITVDNVQDDKFKEGKLTAQIRQTVKTIYPAQSVGNDKSDSLFGAQELGIGDGKAFESTRVVWIEVPEGSTAESVQAKLDKCPDARIYQILSQEAILHDGQEHAIKEGLRTLEDFEASQMIKDGDENPILYNGAEQYSARFFATSAKEDIDLRDDEVEAPAAANAMAEEENTLAS